MSKLDNVNDCLPDGFEEVRTKGKYFNIGHKSVPDGDYHIRIVQKPICGWTEFSSVEKKSFRYRPSQRPKKPRDPTQEISRFWACYIWNYASKQLEVAQFNQNTIIAALEKLAVMPGWGSWLKYDIVITKNTALKKYSIQAMPHASLSAEILKAVKDAPVRLEALYDGGNPWTDLEESSVPDVQMEVPF